MSGPETTEEKTEEKTEAVTELAGDDTADASETTDATEETSTQGTSTEETATEEASTEEASTEETSTEETVAAESEPSGIRTWLARNRKAVAAASVAGFVLAGGFAGAAVQPYLMDRAMVTTKLKIARTAADAITTLWSYTPEDMDRLSDRSARFLGGDFVEQYRKYVDAIAPTNKQAKVSSTTKVVGAAVESLRGEPEPTEATAIVYTNTTSMTPQNNNIPAMKYLSYRLELKRYGREWRVTKMTTVTSLDLSPKVGL